MRRRRPANGLSVLSWVVAADVADDAAVEH